MTVPAPGQRVFDKQTGQLGYLLSFTVPIGDALAVLGAVQWEDGGSATVAIERLRPIEPGGWWIEMKKVKAPE